MMEYDEYLGLINYLRSVRYSSVGQVAAFCAKKSDTINDLINSLIALGAPIERCEKGIRLQESRFVDALSHAEITKNITNQRIIDLHLLVNTQSTNKYLRQLASDVKACGAVAVAESQSAGVGRSGKRWISPFGAAIYFSLRTTVNTPVDRLSAISLVIGLCVIKTLATFNLENLTVKWPNDIYYNAKKLSGILIETVKQEANSVDLIIGIGINVRMNNKIEIDQDWIDVYSINESFSTPRNKIIATLINNLYEYIACYEKSGFEYFMGEWHKRDFLYGKDVVLSGRELSRSGVAHGVSKKGELLVNRDGGLLVVSSGEVSVRASCG